ALGDQLFRGLTGAATAVIVALFALTVLVLVEASQPTFRAFGIGFLWGNVWNPNPTVLSPVVFGAGPAIYGTLVVALIGMLIGVPLSLGIAMFLTELSPVFLRGGLSFVIELLAAIPSVVYGLWGRIILVPIMATIVEPDLGATLGHVPGLAGLFAEPSTGYTGYGYLTAGVILAIMVIPTISAITREAFLTVPREQREAALSLGATRWESTRLSVIPYARRGILGAITLGLGRAVGETIAVVLVIGNTYAVSSSLFGAGTSIAAFIANEFGEAAPFEHAGLLELGLILMAVSLVINIGARLLVRRGAVFEEAAA
ncbi:MAG: phosphate ABC transporter permease subunit PstC, partial [Thermoplasmata archaeon]|nr:phosphate ABC transporter permease subunit PstC [Thermoplasmata archaeon]